MDSFLKFRFIGGKKMPFNHTSVNLDQVYLYLQTYSKVTTVTQTGT